MSLLRFTKSPGTVTLIIWSKKLLLERGDTLQCKNAFNFIGGSYTESVSNPLEQKITEL